MPIDPGAAASPLLRRGAVVLCGGRSSRMGQDKAWLTFGDEAMLSRVVRIVSGVVPAANIVVVAAPEQRLPWLPESVRIIRDVEAFQGPLPALIAGIEALRSVADNAFVTSGDAPLVSPEFIEWMFDRFDQLQSAEGSKQGRKVEALIPRGDRDYPLTGIYDTSAHVGFSEALSRGERSLRAALLSGLVTSHSVSPGELQLVDPQLDSLLNCNTSEDYQRALQRASDQTRSQPR